MVFTFNSTCIGASHLRNDKPCQDFSACWSSGNSAIIAVADGHGSEECFRSDRGSRLAAKTALQCLKDFISKTNDRIPNPDSDLDSLENNIITVWHEKIADDVRKDFIEGDILTPYGTTLLAAAMTEHYWFAVQIGDGKCVVIEKNREDEDLDYRITQPVPWDERCFLNRTTSLCDKHAKNLFRHYYSETLPSAVFLGTDGIDNSFSPNNNREYLAEFYRNVFYNFINNGPDEGKTRFDEALPLLTKKGSGDDVTVAGIIGNLTVV